MAAVTIQRVTRQFGTQVVLQDISLELHAGQVAGLIGANGSGKTTLFRLITGELEPDRGTVTRARGLEIGFLRQELDFSLERSLREEVASAFDDVLALESRLHELSEEMASCEESERLAELMESYERVNSRFITAGGHSFEARLNEILGGLGFSREDHDRPMAILSGGQKCRAALAKLLLVDKPFFLLDEPTNHLDLDAVRWLEKFLAGHHGGVVVISHDRYLLDRLCDRIIELEDTRVVSYPGNYSNYAKVKGVRRLTQQRQFQRDSEFISKERAFIAKHLAGQRTKEAQGRRKRLERRIANGEFVTEAPGKRREVSLSFRESDTKSVTVLRCDELSMAFGNLTLFSELTFQVPGAARFGITGPNGTGKTTLLRILLGELTPTSGTSDLDPKLSVGYYSQEHVDRNPERSVLEEVRAAAPHFTEQDARTLLGAYLFRGEDVFKTLGSLSGGEQSRVRLLKLILEQPDVLILDEPTNHLDIPSRESLEEALSAFAGTIIVVSHDRYFLDRIVDRLLVIRRNGHALYDGNYSYYIQEEETQRASASTPSATRRGKSGRASAPRKAAGSGPSPLDPLPIEEIEALLIERETRLEELQAQFGDEAIYKNPDRLAELRRQVEAAKRELSEVDEAWRHRADAQ